MKQLPGRARPRWLQLIVTGVLTAVATIWLVTLLPFLFVQPGLRCDVDSGDAPSPS
jgi:hypothetical protein